MIRVFHIIGRFDVGGAERVAVNIARSGNSEFEYHVVELLHAHSKFTNSFIEELKEWHIHYHRGIIPIIPSHYIIDKFAAVTFPLWFIFIYLKYRPQVIHCHTEMPDLAVYCFFKVFPWLLKRTKIVRTIHNTQLWYGMKRTGARIERWMQKQNANISISSSVSDEYNKNYHQLPPMIFNGVAPTMQKKYQGLCKGKINILFAGRFEAQKGIDVLADTVKAMSVNDKFFFHIVGSGRLESHLRESLQGYGNFRISPPIFGINAYLQSFDFLFMPSLHEGLSILSIEASMSGLPVVANDCEGLRDTLPPDWPLKAIDNDVATYIRIFTATDSKQKEEYAAISKKFVLEHFSIEKMQYEYEQVYRKLSIGMSPGG